jgi:hypothetical protein
MPTTWSQTSARRWIEPDLTLMEAGNDLPRTKGQLIQRIESDWAALDRLASSLSETQMTTPGPEGWAPKDHVMHIAEWERSLTAYLARRPDHEGFGIDAATFAPLRGNIDAINEVLHQRNRGLSVSEVRASAREAHAELMDALERLTDGDVAGTVADFGVDADDDRPFAAGIGDDTFEHYPEHTAWIKALL